MLIYTRFAIFTAIRIVLSLLGCETTVSFAEIGCLNIQHVSENGSFVLSSSEALAPIYQIPRNQKPEEPSIQAY
jgi:hypothetical protein